MIVDDEECKEDEEKAILQIAFGAILFHHHKHALSVNSTP